MHKLTPFTIIIIQERNLLDNTDPKDWLNNKVRDHNTTQNSVELPLRDDGSEYKTADLFKDQKEIVAVVMSKIKEWLECEDLSTFRPLRLVVNGSGGSGKSVVINTLITLMRRMFLYNDVVKIVAPTGTAAFNVKGETFHHLLGERVSSVQYKPNSMSAAKREMLVKKFKMLLLLIVDERSLVSHKLLGTAERKIAETIYEGGQLRHLSFGGLPVVMLVGDDYQLPSSDEGPLLTFNKIGMGAMTMAGRKALLECTENVMELGGSKRIKADQIEDKELVARIRVATETEIPQKDVDKIQSLHLDNIRLKHGPDFVADIEKRAIYLFFLNSKRVRHNLFSLSRVCSKENPVALCKPITTGKETVKGDRRHFSSKAPTSCLLSVGAKVALDNKNFCPVWGLHNGACGTIEEIVFGQGKNPNHGDLPDYVVVNFPLYCGPTWDADNPTHVPIPLAEYGCDRRNSCCTRIFVPLCLAYARTIHKFQGLTAGPVDPGKIKNMFDVIVCDPDDNVYEGTNLGLLYTAISRATTLGNEDGTGSAIYFTGEAILKKERISRIAMCKESANHFKRVYYRRRWCAHIKKNTKKCGMSLSRIQQLLKWVNNTKEWDTTKPEKYTRFQTRIDDYKRAKANTTNDYPSRRPKRSAPKSARSQTTLKRQRKQRKTQEV